MAEKNPEETMRKFIEILDITHTLTDPLKRSIENLLKLSANSMKSEEASVIIRDGDNGDLRFLFATGKVADQLIGLKIPSGKGIAGFVFASGQPVAIADVGLEESFYAEVDKKTGYSTQTILATPLRHEGNIIGVLEFVNRVGEPPFEPFTPFEMDKAALFADAIASLVDAFETAVLGERIGSLMFKDESEDKEFSGWVSQIRASAEHQELLELAFLIRKLSDKGEKQKKICREIIEVILNNCDEETESSFLSF